MYDILVHPVHTCFKVWNTSCIQIAQIFFNVVKQADLKHAKRMASSINSIIPRLHRKNCKRST